MNKNRTIAEIRSIVGACDSSVRQMQRRGNNVNLLELKEELQNLNRRVATLGELCIEILEM